MDDIRDTVNDKLRHDIRIAVRNNMPCNPHQSELVDIGIREPTIRNVFTYIVWPYIPRNNYAAGLFTEQQYEDSFVVSRCI